ncbi:MAG: hypothetical protein U9N54_11160 [candidate division Zixibacteria bacterium]|nr:hypothetical protein [candidate division Zixibacteria bacterium]
MGLMNLLFNNFGNEYQNLINKINNRYKTPNYYTPSQTISPVPEPATDKYVPSTEALAKQSEQPEQPQETAQNSASPVNNPNSTPETEQTDTPQEESPTLPINPDGTYQSYSRKSRLDYSLNLQFNLGIFTSSVEELANGNLQSLEEMAMGGFGLKADMNFQGFQQVRAMAEQENNPASVVKSKMLSSSGLANKFSANSRNFAVNSFYNEASKISRSYHSIDNGKHRMAVNKIGFRYQLDSGFNFTFLNKFNTQTEQMAQQTPDMVNNYIDSAGSLAESGTIEMMSTFFDAVDTYLNQSEKDLIAKANEYFDMAVEELGFSGAMVDTAKESFVSSIESFFNRVDNAIETVQDVYVPQTENPAPELSPEYFNPAEYNQADNIAVA